LTTIQITRASDILPPEEIAPEKTVPISDPVAVAERARQAVTKMLEVGRQD
jgi:hypothetical protein